MLTLSPALIAEKNKIESEGAWVFLVHLTSPDNTYDLKFARNTEDVIYEGDTYQAFPFEMSEAQEDGTGKVLGISLQVSNVDRIAQSYIEQDETFGSNWDVRLILVHTELVNTEDFTPLMYKFKSKSVICNKEYATFSLGLANPFRIQIPSQKYSPISCQRTFNDGRGCPYETNILAEYKSYPNQIIQSNLTTFDDGVELDIESSSDSTYLKEMNTTQTDENGIPSGGYSSYLAFRGSNFKWISTGDSESKIQDLGQPQSITLTYTLPKVISGFELDCWIGTSGYLDYPIQYAFPPKIKIQAKNISDSEWITLLDYTTSYINGRLKIDIPNNDLDYYTQYRLYFDDFTNIPSSATSIALRNVTIFEKTIKTFTSCNGTLAECKERYPNGRVVNGINLGYPFNGKLGMTQQAIYT